MYINNKNIRLLYGEHINCFGIWVYLLYFYLFSNFIYLKKKENLLKYRIYMLIEIVNLNNFNLLYTNTFNMMVFIRIKYIF